MSCSESAPITQIRLAAWLDLKAAAPLLKELLDARGSDAALEAGDVRRLGGQCLQVLVAAREAWTRDGRTFDIRSPSSAFTETAVLMGGAEALGLTTPEEFGI
jgi:chemotaxis protein CheX